MNERTKELISAMFDDEANEKEVQRILAQSHDEALMAYCHRISQQRGALKADQQAFAGVDLRDGINRLLDSQAVSTEPSEASHTAGEGQLSPPRLQGSAERGDDIPGKTSDRGAINWWKGFAVAASVGFLMVLGVQFGLEKDEAPQYVQLENSDNRPLGASGSETGIIADKVVDSAPGVAATQNAEATAEQSLPAFSEEHERRLNAYLMRHTGNAAFNSTKGIVPFARLTSFQPPAELVTEEAPK